MPEIRDHVRSNLGETYLKLVDVGRYDGQLKPDVVGVKITVALSKLFPEGQDPDLLSEFARSYVRDVVTRMLVPLAIDYYMVHTRLVDNAGRPAGVTPLGGEVGENYNRVQTLLQLDKLLAQRIEADATAFATAVGSTASSWGIRVSEHSKDLLTQDVWDAFDPIDSLATSSPFGVGLTVSI